ncbi:MAG: DUF4910 domain-containing protein [Nitrospiraceae bacterium]
MTLAELELVLAKTRAGQMYGLMKELYPICRSITGNGVRETLARLGKRVPLHVHEVASGTPVFDWMVPLEWNVRDAYLATIDGHRVVDFRDNNLHVVGYSVPFQGRVSRDELESHLHSLPEHPDWIPYRTSYYKGNWGFCLSHRERLELRAAEYDVRIEATLEKGSLTYGELLIPGESDQEILISSHVCHPSLCNDNLSGIVVATMLAELLSGMARTYSYRFLFIPGTIGSITWLARNQDQVGRIQAGLVLTGIGDGGGVTYKQSRRGISLIDRAMAHVLKHRGKSYRIIEFYPYGYDERQYCSPGFNLPVGCLMRTPHGEYPEYHTSADNLELVKAESLQDSLDLVLNALYVLENDTKPVSKNPFCEPQLGRRGLYRAIAGQKEGASSEMALLWVLNMADEEHSLLDIAEKAQIPFVAIHAASKLLEAEWAGPRECCGSES